MYFVKTVNSLHELEHLLNVTIPLGAEVISINVLDLPLHHQFVVTYKVKHATQTN